MTFQAAICDDDPQFALQLQKYILAFCQKNDLTFHLEVYTDSSALFHILMTQQKHYDILFLDIDMPGLNGIQLAEHIRKLKAQPYFIFVSGVEALVFQSFLVNPFWFVRKRLWKTELKNALSALKKELSYQEEQMLTISIKGSVKKIDIHSLQYVECTDKILHLHYRNPVNNTEFPYKLSDLEEQLSEFGFIRVHKGYLANYRSIFNIDRAGILLDNGETIPVSKYRLKEIKEIYTNLI